MKYNFLLMSTLKIFAETPNTLPHSSHFNLQPLKCKPL